MRRPRGLFTLFRKRRSGTRIRKNRPFGAPSEPRMWLMWGLGT